MSTVEPEKITESLGHDHLPRLLVPEYRRRLDEPGEQLEHLAFNGCDGIRDLAVGDLYPSDHAGELTHACGSRRALPTVHPRPHGGRRECWALPNSRLRQPVLTYPSKRSLPPRFGVDTKAPAPPPVRPA
jgi:hypothetical protein